MSLIIRMNTSYISYMFFLHGMPWTHHIVQLIIDIYLCSHIKWLWIKSLYLEERILDVNKSYQKSIGFFTFKRILFFFFLLILLYFTSYSSLWSTFIISGWEINLKNTEIVHFVLFLCNYTHTHTKLSCNYFFH